MDKIVDLTDSLRLEHLRGCSIAELEARFQILPDTIVKTLRKFGHDLATHALCDRQGYRWEKFDNFALESFWNEQRYQLSLIASALGRSDRGVFFQLRSLGLIPKTAIEPKDPKELGALNSSVYVCHCAIFREDALPTNSTPTPVKEPQMQLKIETKTFINGRDIASLSVDDYVDIYCRVNDRLINLGNIKNPPQIVKDEIAQLSGNMQKLTVLMDKAEVASPDHV